MPVYETDSRNTQPSSKTFIMLLKLIICAALIFTISGHPVSNDEEVNISESAEIRRKANDVKLVEYIQTFKDMMLDYVKSQYKNLTINEMEAVKDALEDFLHNFAKDLKEVIEKGNDVTEVDEINDGIPESTFDDMKNNIKIELPNLSDESAKLIVYKLRKNLMITRYRIDRIINDSQKASIENDS